MTAVVGILNKQAIAIAADSAVTVNSPNGHRIFNQANKIFTLSKVHPVSVMIYSAASFMGTPWETIIKVYRKQLKEQSFNTLKEYTVDFIQFLKNKNYYTDQLVQSNFLKGFALNIIDLAFKDVSRENPEIVKGASIEKPEVFLEALEMKMDNLISIWHKTGKDICPEFSDYTFEMFETYSDKTFKEIKDGPFQQKGLKASDKLLMKIKKVIFNILRAKENISSYTGLIFTGFGEEEIYPQLIPLNISLVVDNRLRYFLDENSRVSISNRASGAIRPFAQTDVINTILSGIDPLLEKSYLENFKAIFEKYNQEILKNIKEEDSLLRKQIENLATDSILELLIRQNNLVKQKNYIRPLMNAVSHLSKEDLAEMAESLIYLTFLKRRITFAEESVGGPIDVAILSKGDGFVWIKRKHYFKPELNPHFFDNYFKK